MKLDTIETNWDIIIAGGGITGAGVFRKAVLLGLRVLLIEQNDFAWGTSSRSSKMVHGGLRYLKQGRLFLTRASVKERQALLSETPGLVDPLKFTMPVYNNYGPSKALMGLGLSLYSLLALKKQYTCHTSAKTAELIPFLQRDNLLAGFSFMDAQVDDARLVLRVINEGTANGGTALNYTKALEIKRDQKGNVAAVIARDTEEKISVELKTKVFINATGAWAENLHPSPVKNFHLRPLRGSHLIFPGHLFPCNHVVSFIHPLDNRPVFIFPWEGCAILGTTDVDHTGELNQEPSITHDEASYLMHGLKFIMPGLKMSEKDCISSIAGVRSVLSCGKSSASKESREHVIWKDKGVVTVTGGKLTTFRLIASSALKAVKEYLPVRPVQKRSQFFEKTPYPAGITGLSQDAAQRIYGRYGMMAETLVKVRNKAYHPFR